MVQALKEMITGKLLGRLDISLELIGVSGEFGIKLMVELCHMDWGCQLNWPQSW